MAFHVTPGPPEALFMLAINWKESGCGAGQGDNYRALEVSDAALGPIKPLSLLWKIKGGNSMQIRSDLCAREDFLEWHGN